MHPQNLSTPTKTKAGRARAVASRSAGSAQLAHYLPQAMALAPGDVIAFKISVSLATANAERGVRSVLAHERGLARALPEIDLGAVHDLADLGSALAFAAAQVARFAPTPTNIKATLAEARRLRALLLAGADMLVLAGVFSAAVVAKIRQGHGPIDAAGDCVALAALYTEHASAITGKVAVTSDDVRRADEIGARLLRMLRPQSAKRPVDPALVAATDVRDRLWTLFDRAWHDNVWRAGAWLFGREVERYVPPLHSRVQHRRARGTTPPAVPASGTGSVSQDATG